MKKEGKGERKEEERKWRREVRGMERRKGRGK